MLEMIVFAITLVVSNVVASLIMVRMVMSKRFMKKYFAMINDMALGCFDEDDED